MQNKILRKGLVIGIIILFVGISIIPSNANVLNVNISTDDEVFSIPLDSRGIIYVDDDNTGGPWDGTLEHPYQYIQDGVDNAVEGDTVFVFNGTYYKPIVMKKGSIKLVGEDKNTTIIDGSGRTNTIYIQNNSDSNHITGFTITKGTYGIKCISNYNKIYNNIFRGSVTGIEFYSFWEDWDVLQGSYNEIFCNIVEKNKQSGIDIVGDDNNYDKKCRNNRVYKNIISNNGFGLIVGGLGCKNTEVYKNLIYNNTYGNLDVWGNFNSITNNDIRNSIYGIKVDMSFVNTIEKNNFINNGIDAELFDSLGNRWIRNYWDDWSGFGPKIIHGTFTLSPSEDIHIRNFDFRPARKPYDIIITNDIAGCGIV